MIKTKLTKILNIRQKYALNVIYIYFQEYFCSLCCIFLTQLSGSLLIKLVILAGRTLKSFWGNSIQTPFHVFNYLHKREVLFGAPILVIILRVV